MGGSRPWTPSHVRGSQQEHGVRRREGDLVPAACQNRPTVEPL